MKNLPLFYGYTNNMAYTNIRKLLCFHLYYEAQDHLEVIWQE